MKNKREGMATRADSEKREHKGRKTDQREVLNDFKELKHVVSTHAVQTFFSNTALKESNKICCSIDLLVSASCFINARESNISFMQDTKTYDKNLW